MTRVVVDRIETQQDSLRLGDPIGCHYHWLEPDEVDSYGDSVRRLAGKVELGAAWKKTSAAEQRDYLSVKLDDPSFPREIYASLMDADEGYNLIWSRSRSR